MLPALLATSEQNRELYSELYQLLLWRVNGGCQNICTSHRDSSNTIDSRVPVILKLKVCTQFDQYEMESLSPHESQGCEELGDTRVLASPDGTKSWNGWALASIKDTRTWNDLSTREPQGYQGLKRLVPVTLTTYRLWYKNSFFFPQTKSSYVRSKL